MLFTKTWIVLLSLAAALALGMALVTPGPATRDLTQKVVENLDRAQHNAEMMLRLEARDWIDTAAKMARDKVLVEILSGASDRTGDMNTHKAKLQGRLLSLVSMLATEARPKLVIALDVNGKQIYRMGLGEDSYTPGKDGLIGYPLVEEALRGGRRDDTWNINGKLFLMAATPVISRAKGRYVGALLLGEAINDAFARRFKLQLGGTELALFLNGKTVGSTFGGGDVAGLPKLLADPKHKKALGEKGRTSTILVGEGASAFYTILTPIPGEAGVQDAFYALIKQPPVSRALPEVMARVTDGDLAMGLFPWPLLGGALLVALLVGLLLNIWEVSMPLKRLDKELARIKRGDIIQLDLKGYGGRFNRLAAAINVALAKNAHARPASGSFTPAVEPLPTPSSAAVSPRKAEEAKIEDASVPAVAAPLDKKGGFMPAGMDPEELATEIQKLPPEMVNADPYDTVLDPRPTADLPGSKKQQPAYEDDATGASDQQSEVVVSASGATAPRDDKIDEEEAISKASTVMSSISQSLAQADARAGDDEEKAELERYIESVYTDFVEMKTQCGEETAKLTLERFGAKLRRNRANLIKRFGCKTVKFQVYVKDGKAALKATPIKN